MSEQDHNKESLTRPFDEKADAVSVQRGLAMFAEPGKTDEAVHVLRQTSARSSSLVRLNFPFIALPSDDKASLSSSFCVKGSINLDDGCYLIYDAASGGTLVLHYSHEKVPENAIGFFRPSQQIQEFKYTNHGGYVELIRGIIGGDKNKKLYLSGWCQVVQIAKHFKGRVQKVDNPQQGLKVDIYGWYADGTVCPLCQQELDGNALVDVSNLNAVAVVPHANDRFVGVKHLTELAFLQLGDLEGASLKLHD